MWALFWLDHLHFAVSLLSAVALFAVSWLYVDAWHTGRSVSRLASVIGFSLAGMSYLFEGPLLSEVAGRTGMAEAALAVAAVRAFGFAFLAVGAWSEPLMQRPKLNAGMVGAGWAIGPMALSPIAAALAALGVMRRGTLGLEAHMRPLAVGLFLFAASELLRLYATITGTSLPDVTAAISTGGTVWWIRLVLLALAALVTLKWVTYYLFRQVFVQMFLAFQWTAISSFFLITVVFTALLLKTVTAQTADHLRISAGVLSAVLSARRDALSSDLTALAKEPAVIAMPGDGHSLTATSYLSAHLSAQGLSILRVTDKLGNIVAAGESERSVTVPDQTRMASVAIAGQPVADTVRSQVGNGQVILTAAVPVTQNGKNIGAVIGGLGVDEAFLHGIRAASGLDAWIVVDNKIAAGGTEGIRDGLAVADTAMIESAMRQKQPAVGEFLLADTRYYGAAIPLLNADGTAVAVIVTAKPLSEQLKIGNDAVAATFFATILLSLVMTLPVWAVSTAISRQFSV
jgi:hypothetical protein